jgi:hypothetical protein
MIQQFNLYVHSKRIEIKDLNKRLSMFAAALSTIAKRGNNTSVR